MKDDLTKVRCKDAYGLLEFLRLCRGVTESLKSYTLLGRQSGHGPWSGVYFTQQET